MPSTNRLYYACEAVQINGPSGLSSKNPLWDTIQGLQSVGINTNFNLEPIYQLGQLDLYDNYEEIPEVEISLSKVLDGQPPIYEMAMGTGTLVSLANNRCGVRLLLYPDTNTTADGTPIAAVECAPSYLSSVSYNFPTEGNFTEEVTLVSNDKSWLTSLSTITGSPASSSAAGLGIARRGLWNKSSTVLPTGSSGVLSLQSASGGIPADMKLQSVKVSLNLGREQLRELGSRTPYLRYVKFPVEVTTDIEVIANSGDMVGVAGSSASACSNPKALSDKQIKIALCDGMTLDLGAKNKLTSVNFNAGDTGGSNASITYSYRGYSAFTFSGPTGTSAGLVQFTDVVEVGLPSGTDFGY
jgi:hypothetical protein